MLKTLYIRIDSENKQSIEARAREAHISTSEYVRRLVLQNPSAMSDIVLRQKLVNALCRHAQLVNKMESPLKKEFTSWEEALWQLIK